ncbi:polyprenyl synthetase family protein [Mycolicibacterium crocinum]|uniref:Polyprenyl synthetase family protein n=2 Tax=Mycolicibacterium crocinum TaxID=388459 RepID=A0ABY3TGJ9_9MYCO|nr:polyprenyl synthetase family protein [Mycolicibacterium crocinum]ULN39273.1 polyprenyl synthetase family protein [Mycolicibacterium crocinum]
MTSGDRAGTPVMTHVQPSGARAPRWLDDVRTAARAHIGNFVRTECVPRLAHSGVDIAGEVLQEFVDGGKYLRSTFMYLGWLCGAAPDEAALRACASLELLHAFALIQDDVMDGSVMRRAMPAVHVRLRHWHRDRSLGGPADRFGESGATLLADLCLVWAEQMLRRSGVSDAALARVWPRYDDMRVELAVGQFADLVAGSGGLPNLDAVLEMLRRKSGNYTVRRPLELGAAMAGCDAAVLEALSGYGSAIGEAFQLRDDVLGVFGSPELTGKSACTDMESRKATSVLVAAHELADAGVRSELDEVMALRELDDAAVERWRSLVRASGAVQWVEERITQLRARALNLIEGLDIPEQPRSALIGMAHACTVRMA